MVPEGRYILFGGRYTVPVGLALAMLGGADCTGAVQGRYTEGGTQGVPATRTRELLYKHPETGQNLTHQAQTLQRGLKTTSKGVQSANYLKGLS